MKGKATLSSIFLVLTLPNFALANVPNPSSVSSLNQEQFNSLGTVEIAQSYLSARYVSSRLYSSQSRILGVARGYSDDVKWKSISVEIISDQRIKLNLFGKIPRKLVRDPNIRVGLYLQRDSQGGFRFTNYDWNVSGGRCEAPCKNKVRSKLNGLPNEYTRFQQVLNSILA